MLRIPFHRRILPWVFVIAFVFMAPALVFYTAGYRWNSKKGVIERNGTFIIDTKPRDALIKINGKDLPDTTPVTLQNTAPGTYSLKITKEGYHDWLKVLNIEPERVTFATDIHLWPDVEPILLMAGSFEKIFTDPDNNVLLIASTTTSATYSFSLYNVKDNKLVPINFINDKINSIKQIQWDTNGDEAVIYSADDAAHRIDFTERNTTALPVGYYHYEKGELIGNSNGYTITIGSNGVLSRKAKIANVVDTFGSMQLAEITNNAGLVFMEDKDAQQGFVLPAGNWYFYDVQKNYILFKDGNRWLRLQTIKEPFTFTIAYGDVLQQISLNRVMEYLIHNYNEVLTWPADKEPDLIYRQSEPIIASAWHADGLDIMLATSQAVSMIQLDDRSGRYKTTLANFDNITAAVIYDNKIILAGSKDGLSGIWSLPLENQSSGSSPFGTLW